VSGPAPRRRPRLIGVLIGAGAAVALIALFASLSLDEGDTDPIQIDHAGEVRRLIGGLPQLDERLGEDDAPVTVEVFNDLQCTYCADWQRDVVDPLIADEARDGDVKFLYRHWSMTERASGIASYGAVAAGLQGQQWQYIELFFRNQGEAQRFGVTQEVLDEIAKGVLNLNIEQWQRDFEDPEIPERLEEDDLLAVQRRLPAEPAVVVTGPGGSRELVETPSLADVRAAIDEVSSIPGG
jgi:protein-disulfide isomerase